MSKFFKALQLYVISLFVALTYATAGYAQLSTLPNGFPDNDGGTGKMLDAINGFATLGETNTDITLNIHIRVPVTTPALSIEIFDGDFNSDITSTLQGFYDLWDIDLDFVNPPFGIDTVF